MEPVEEPTAGLSVGSPPAWRHQSGAREREGTREVGVGFERMTIMRKTIELAAVLLAGAVAGLTACGEDEPAAKNAENAASLDSTEATLPPFELESDLPPSVREAVLKPFTGDLDEIVKRRAVRLGVTFNRTFYFVDRGAQRGIAYEYGRLMEARLNKRFKTNTSNRIQVIFLPLPREMLLSALTDGKVDLVAAQIPVTPELEKYVSFSDPTRMNVNQILVTGPGAPAIASIDDLSGHEVFARTLGGYHQSLVEFNEKFKAQGKAPMNIREAPRQLEDDDLLEMVNAGLIPAIVVDDYLARFW
jgi:ABC-type amino acid transport substrate-binding protein